MSPRRLNHQVAVRDHVSHKKSTSNPCGFDVTFSTATLSYDNIPGSSQHSVVFNTIVLARNPSEKPRWQPIPRGVFRWRNFLRIRDLVVTSRKMQFW
jgi:hypothetical protein